jgi:RNA polymerase sigma factor FliA
MSDAGRGVDDADASRAEAGLAELWSQFQRERTQELRDRLILQYAPLVKYVAGRLGAGLPQSVEQSDLVQGGIFGLVDAIERFEPEREIKFETYAIPRIRGAILDGLRAMDWVPRSVRLKARQVDQAQGQLESELGRAPSDAEVAERLGVELGELQDMLRQISFVSVMALDEESGDEEGGGSRSLADSLADSQSLDPMAEVEGKETVEILGRSIDQLPERERFVVRLYYYEGLTLAQIGGILGVTESRVCQIHTKAVRTLRGSMADAEA